MRKLFPRMSHFAVQPTELAWRAIEQYRASSASKLLYHWELRSRVILKYKIKWVRTATSLAMGFPLAIVSSFAQRWFISTFPFRNVLFHILQLLQSFLTFPHLFFKTSIFHFPFCIPVIFPSFSFSSQNDLSSAIRADV
jgi:hypothetical protein